MRPLHLDPETPWYQPRAVYYSQSDSVEYLRKDVPTVYRRIDECLTLILSMRERNVIGLKIKGFRHFYLSNIKPKYNFEEKHFLYLIYVLEEAMTCIGEEILSHEDRREAYRLASEIAQEDNVILSDLSEVA